MERLRYIVDQLELCKRLTLGGSVSDLRITLLLLDNAAEVLMHRAIESELMVSAWYERMHHQIPPEANGAEATRLRAEIGEQMVSADSKRKLRRFFDEKIRFLSQDRSIIDPRLGRALSATHRYRNEIHHRDKVRKEILEPVVRILFELVSGLLVPLGGRRATGFVTLGESSWLERYGITSHFALQEDGLTIIRDTLRAGLHLDTVELAEALSRHLIGRVAEVERALTFVAENLPFPRELTAALALRVIQFFHSRKPPPSFEEFDAFTPVVAFEDLAGWRRAALDFSKLEDRMELLGRFADLDETIEPIEQKIQDAASEIDAAIQREIDIRRGK